MYIAQFLTVYPRCLLITYVKMYWGTFHENTEKQELGKILEYAQRKTSKLLQLHVPAQFY